MSRESQRQRDRELASPLHPLSEAAPPIAPDIGEALLALAVVVFGLLVVWQTTQIRLTPAYAKVGPRVLPYIIGAGLILVGLWLAFESITGRTTAGSAESEDVDLSLPTDWRCIGLLALSLLAYLVLIEPAGFVVASALLFFGAAFAMGSRRYVRDIAIGIVLATVLYVGFSHGLGLRLPAGILEGII